MPLGLRQKYVFWDNTYHFSLFILGYLLCDCIRVKRRVLIWFSPHNAIVFSRILRMDPVLDSIFINSLVKVQIWLLSVLTWLKSCVMDTLSANQIPFTSSASQLFCVWLLTACTCDLQRLIFGHWKLLAPKESQKAGEFSEIHSLYNWNMHT